MLSSQVSQHHCSIFKHFV